MGIPAAEMPSGTSKIGHDLFDLANKASMMAQMRIGGTSEAIFVSSMAALGALVTTAAQSAKKPDGVTERSSREEQARAIAQMVNQDTILFGALLAYRMFQETVVDDEGDFATRSEYSPEAVHFAIADWQKMTGKDPASYLHQGMVKADRETFFDTEGPLAELMKARKSQLSSGSGTLQ